LPKHVKLIDEIVQKAVILEKMGIKGMDALHLACAEEAKADFFLTCDEKIVKRYKGCLCVKNPIDFMKIFEGKRMIKTISQIKIPRNEEIKVEAINLMIEKMGIAKTASFIKEMFKQEDDYLKIKERIFNDKKVLEISNDILKEKSH